MNKKFTRILSLLFAAIIVVSMFSFTASADGLEWNGKTWSIVNHFIPFTEDEVDAPGRFESDSPSLRRSAQ